MVSPDPVQSFWRRRQQNDALLSREKRSVTKLHRYSFLTDATTGASRWLLAFYHMPLAAFGKQKKRPLWNSG